MLFVFNDYCIYNGKKKIIFFILNIFLYTYLIVFSTRFTEKKLIENFKLYIFFKKFKIYLKFQ